jgi:hypothetical protein
MEDINKTGNRLKGIKKEGLWEERRAWMGEGEKTIYGATHLVMGVQISCHELATSKRE